MKTKIKLLTPVIVVAMIICTHYVSFAQNATLAKFEGPDILTSPPQVWSFMKYGNTPMDLYRGIAQTQIPIYTYKDKDFELPVSINYASSGFMPNVQTGVLGLGWFLNAGGCITREIRDVPDEAMVTLSKFNAQSNLGPEITEYHGYLSCHESHNGDAALRCGGYHGA